VADRLVDLRLHAAFGRFLDASESVTEADCPALPFPGEAEQEQLIDRMLRLGRDWGRGDTPADVLRVELFGVLCRMQIVAYFEGYTSGYRFGKRPPG
jgi:hypothetical protein